MTHTKGLGLGRLLKLSSMTLGRQLIAILCQLGLVLLLARLLGSEGNGQFTVALLLPMLLTSLLNLGIPSANVYFLGRSGVSIADAMVSNLKLWGVLTAIGLIAGVIGVAQFSETLFPGVPEKLLWGAVAIFPVSLFYALLISLLQGKQDFRAYNLVMIIPSVASLLLAVAFVWGMGLGVGAALLSWGLGQLVGVIVLVGFLVSLRRGNVRESYDSTGYVKRCLNYGWRSHLSNVITFLNYRADIFLVNMLINPAGAGIYIVSVRIAEGLWLLSQAVSTILLPKLSSMHANEELRRKITPICARWVTYVGLLFSVALAVTASSLIDLLFGVQYSEAALVLLWLLPGTVVFNTARVLANDIAARGRPELNIWSAAITLVVNVVGNILLIPEYGLKGAAIATTLSYMVTTVASLAFYSHLSSNPWWSPLVLEKNDWYLVKQLVRMSGK